MKALFIAVALLGVAVWVSEFMMPPSDSDRPVPELRQAPHQ